MKERNREVVKALIELSADTKEADKVIVENYGFKSIAEKIAFLKGMFDIEVFSVHNQEGTSKEESDEITYSVMLDAIIIHKWR